MAAKQYFISRRRQDVKRNTVVDGGGGLAGVEFKSTLTTRGRLPWLTVRHTVLRSGSPNAKQSAVKLCSRHTKPLVVLDTCTAAPPPPLSASHKSSDRCIYNHTLSDPQHVRDLMGLGAGGDGLDYARLFSCMHICMGVCMWV